MLHLLLCHAEDDNVPAVRFERYLILSAIAYVLFSLILIALTQTSASRRLSVFTAIGLGVAANAVTSILTFAATRLHRQWRARGPR